MFDVFQNQFIIFCPHQLYTTLTVADVFPGDECGAQQLTCLVTLKPSCKTASKEVQTTCPCFQEVETCLKKKPTCKDGNFVWDEFQKVLLAICRATASGEAEVSPSAAPVSSSTTGSPGTTTITPPTQVASPWALWCCVGTDKNAVSKWMDVGPAKCFSSVVNSSLVHLQHGFFFLLHTTSF